MSVHLATFDGISVDDIADCVLTNCKMVNANLESGNTDPEVTFDLKSTLYDGQNILPFLTVDTSYGHASVQGVTKPRQLSISSSGILTLNHPYNIEIIRSDEKIYYPVLSQQKTTTLGGVTEGTDVLILRNPAHLEVENEDGQIFYPMQYLINNDNSGISAIDETSTVYGHINPIYQGEETTKKIYFGTSTYRFGGMYLGASPNVSSDKNLKTNISPFDSRYDDAYLNIEPVTYMWKNLRSGDSHDRLHYGFLAQDIEKAFNDAGITTEEMGFLCRDFLERPNEAGEIVEYSMRYEELIALNTHMTQKALRKINELEAEIAELKLEINKLSNNNL